MNTVSNHQSDILGSPEFCQKLVNDRPEIDNELQSEPMHPVNYVSDFWTDLSNGRPSEDLSAPTIEPIDNAHTILFKTTFNPPSSIDKFLASCKETQGYNKDSYLPLNVISPSQTEEEGLGSGESWSVQGLWTPWTCQNHYRHSRSPRRC
jgi:hypothetical protein